ncbi:MAG: cobyrinate a,c-diamide synthase [Lentisphaerales bacterium]|nr:cobyrinate a,c-diamide synthase [Lentisphaerales bacterium]
MKCLVIGGTGSGVGKTSISLGLVRALKERGHKVCTFKVGPDYLDPSWLKLASGNVCYNLDSWMAGPEYVKDLFNKASQSHDIAIVEGVMGMFDGASPTSLTGSTAEVASILGVPVLLVANSHGCARSFAATVKGFNEFEESVTLAGVIANHCGSAGHLSILEQALEAAQQPELLGAIKRQSLPELPGRHLGLHSAEQYSNAENVIAELGLEIESSLKIDALIEKAQRPDFLSEKKPIVTRESTGLRLAIARDEAFQFYYPDNLEALQAAGIEIVEFSPLHDSSLPQNCDGIYIGGGYPEVYAQELSQNSSMLEAIRQHAVTGKFLYAECGGLMYMSQFLRKNEQEKYPMLQLLPFGTEMLEKRKMLGYMTVEFEHDCILGPAGTKAFGHEFHYSQITEESELQKWSKNYTVCGRRKASKPRREGYCNQSIIASYVHLHFASNPMVINGILNSLIISSQIVIDKK